MRAVEILTNLLPYQNLLNEVYLKERNDTALFCKQLKLQYHFITLEIKSKPKEAEIAIENTEVKITFEIKRGMVILSNLYLANAEKNEWIEKRIIEDKSLHENKWMQSPDIASNWESIEKYLDIADRIANVGNNCSAGDNYYPGFYSEISITDKVIRLSQVNRHNAKSIDHKNDYHMRDLNLVIELTADEIPSKDKMDSTRIGKLRVDFSDRSSDNNKKCGKAIEAKIKEEKETYIQA